MWTTTWPGKWVPFSSAAPSITLGYGKCWTILSASRRAPEAGRPLPGQVVVHIQLAVYSIYQFYILPEGGSIFFPQFLIQQVAVEVVDLYHILIRRLGIAREQAEVLILQVVNPFEAFAAIVVPGHAAYL